MIFVVEETSTHHTHHQRKRKQAWTSKEISRNVGGRGKHVTVTHANVTREHGRKDMIRLQQDDWVQGGIPKIQK
jgi:hypothetical protein